MFNKILQKPTLEFGSGMNNCFLCQLRHLNIYIVSYRFDWFTNDMDIQQTNELISSKTLSLDFEMVFAYTAIKLKWNSESNLLPMVCHWVCIWILFKYKDEINDCILSRW